MTRLDKKQRVDAPDAAADGEVRDAGDIFRVEQPGYDWLMETWRDGVVEDIIAYMHDLVSVNVVGMRGSGRSWVVRLVGDRLRQLGVSVLSIRGVSALRERPLAALAVAGVSVPSTTATSAIGVAVSALTKQLGAGTAVLVIDDADNLDEVSVGVIAAAYANRRFPVLSAMRPAGRSETVSRDLIADLHPAVRVTLSPLTFRELHRALHVLLPGAVDPSTVAQIATLSGGLPRLVDAIVGVGRHTGGLVQRDGVWRARGSLWSDRLALSVEPLLADLTDSGLGALTQLVGDGPLPVEDAREAVGGPVFDRLLDSGLLAITASPAGQEVGVFPSLVVEYLRRTRWPEKTQAMSDSGPGGATGLLDNSLTSSRAVTLNMRIAEHWQSELERRRPVWLTQKSPENAVALMTALNGVAASPDEFAEVIGGTTLAGGDSAWIARFVGWQAVLKAMTLDDQDGARQLLARYQAELPQAASQLGDIAAMLQVLSGSLVDESAFVPAKDHGAEGSAVRTVVNRLRLAMIGRTRDALDGLPARRPGDGSDASGIYDITIGLANVMNGDFDAGIEWSLGAMAEAETRLNPGEIQAQAYVAALGLAFSGRLAELQMLLGPALTLDNPTVLHRSYQTGLLELSAASARWCGLTRFSDALVAQAETVGPPDTIGSTLLSTLTISAAALNGGEIDGEEFWRMVELRFSKGHVAGGIIMAAEAVEMCPDAAKAVAAASHASDVQSPFLLAICRYIEAAAAEDAEALARCAADLQQMGAGLHAVKAMVTRSLALRRGGELSASIQVAEDAWALSRQFGRACPGLFFRLGDAVGLTVREREIALMLSDGSPPGAIAETLGLNARTVDNYLSSACRKLGSDGRTDLIRAISTWIAHPESRLA